MLRVVLIATAVAGLGLSSAVAGPGFDDWFWGNAISDLLNDPEALGIPVEDRYSPDDGTVVPERIYYARVPSDVIRHWQQTPNENYGLAIIGRPPNYWTNNCWATTATITNRTARPRLRMDGYWSYADSSAWIKEEDPYFGSVASAGIYQFCLGNGHNVVLMRWSGAGEATLDGEIPGQWRTLSIGAPNWIDANAAFDLYVAPAEWLDYYVTYDFYVPDPPAFLPADINLDGQVDDRDLNLLLSHWGDTDPNPWGVLVGDINEDGFVDDRDLNLLLSAWGDTAAVPEPTALAMLALAGLAIRRRA